MKLNLDCIRDILLTVEEYASPTNPVTIDDPTTLLNLALKKHSDIKYEKLKDYSFEEIEYHIRQCYESGLLINFKTYINGKLSIDDLSPKGHELLSNISSNAVWAKTKSICAGFGDISLKVLKEIAVKVFAEMIRKQTGL